MGDNKGMHILKCQESSGKTFEILVKWKWQTVKAINKRILKEGG